MRNKVTLPALIAVLLISLGTFFTCTYLRSRVVPKKDHIRGILELNRLADTSKALMVGYNYHLLQKYAKANGQTIDIRLTDSDNSYLDSLKQGKVDIVVIPYQDSISIDSVLVSTPVDSITVWLMKHDNHSHMSDLNTWIDSFHKSAEYDSTRTMFLKRYNPLRSRRRDVLSPYDSLMRVYADSVGCDWRMIAAVIYSESHFHIEARSRRGAMGLMQLMPRSMERYGITDPLSPQQNIRAGALLLQTLLKRYYKVGDNMTERYKYALAAYNAGIGRIDDCINFAHFKGVDTSYWINVVNIIPEMNDISIMETGVVKVGPFKGVETIAYVDNVINIYNNFCRICPE